MAKAAPKLTAKQIKQQAQNRSRGVHLTVRGPLHDPLKPPRPAAPSKPGSGKPGSVSKPAASAPAATAAPDPYLTPAQMASYERGYSGDQTGINNDIGTENSDLSGYSAKIAANGAKYAQANDNANWSMGARGLGQSSIRDSDLNDLAATYTTNAYNYATTFNSSLSKLSSDINTRQGDQGMLTNEFNQQAVANAQALTPTVTGDNAQNSAVPDSSFSFDISPLTATAAGMATPAAPNESQITTPAVSPNYSSAQTNATPAADTAMLSGAHPLQNMALGARQSVAGNPSLAAIASQRAGFAATPSAPGPGIPISGVPGIPISGVPVRAPGAFSPGPLRVATSTGTAAPPQAH